jgi:tRNA(Ile)-lysidine synthetase-like protein
VATGPDPAVAAVRLAVRAALSAVAPGSLVLAAVSGGADSLALLAGLAWEAPHGGLRAGVVHVDHGLQPDSGAQSVRVAAIARDLGVEEIHCLEGFHPVGPAGPEGSARAARYGAIDELARTLGVDTVLTGHTRDDQAESVILGLVRGSGARSLAGIPPRRGRYVRPLLELGRDVTVAACAAQGLVPWQDPSNDDTTLLRNAVRHQVLPGLEARLGPGVAESLARTAALLREDTDLLDQLAADAYDGCLAEPGLACAPLAALPTALRRRVLRRWLLQGGVPGGSLAFVHLRAVDELVVRWHGQAGASLPGGLVAVRRCDTLTVETTQA